MEQEEEFLYNGIYRIPSNRLPGYDYATAGLYFVTICTKDRQCYFGKVRNGEMELSEIGNVVNNWWQHLPTQFSNVQLGVHVVMPNHVHGIVSLDESAMRPMGRTVEGVVIDSQPIEDAIYRVSTTVRRGGATGDANPMGKRTLGEIIRWFKGKCTFEINRRGDLSHFSWQPRFHDHIICDDQSLQQIRQYILENPVKWFEDEMFIE